MNSADLVARLRATAGKGQSGPVKSEAADRIEALEAWKAEALEVLRTFAEDGELFGHPDKYQIAARRLVETEDGR